MLFRPTPWLELDKWAWEIETGQYTTGNRSQDSKKHQAICRVRDRLFERHMKAYGDEYGRHGNVIVKAPPRLCLQRLVPPRGTAAVSPKGA